MGLMAKAKKTSKKAKRDDAWADSFLSLRREDRAILAKKLVESLIASEPDPEVDEAIEKAWMKESARRMKAIDNGARTYSYAEVVAEAKRALRKSA